MNVKMVISLAFNYDHTTLYLCLFPQSQLKPLYLFPPEIYTQNRPFVSQGLHFCIFVLLADSAP